MSRAALDRVHKLAMSIPEAERAELARDLMDGLDGTANLDRATAWDAEILGRLAEIDSGTAQLIDRQELRERMKARMGRS